MLVYSYKLYGTAEQFRLVNEAIQAFQFVQNRSLAMWVDAGKVPKEIRQSVGFNEMSANCAKLAKEYSFCKKLNSQARQAAAKRAATSVDSFYARCKNPQIKKKGYPKFNKTCRSVEYKQTGWKFSDNFRKITFTDGFKIGTFALKGGRWLNRENAKQVKRIQIVKEVGGYRLQVVLDLDVESVELPATEQATGYDLGLKSFMTDSRGSETPNPRFLRKGLKKLKRAQRHLSRSKKKGKNRKKRIKQVQKYHAKVANQRKDFARKLAKCVVTSNDVVVFEDLNIKGLASGRLAKSVNDVGWGLFMAEVKKYCEKYRRMLILVDPANTTQACSACGCLPDQKLTLSVRTCECKHCGLILDRDVNAAINILRKAIQLVLDQATAGQAESWSYVLHCLKKAVQDAELLYVYGEVISTSRASTCGVSCLGEVETSQRLAHTSSDYLYSTDTLSARSAMGIPLL